MLQPCPGRGVSKRRGGARLARGDNCVPRLGRLPTRAAAEDPPREVFEPYLDIPTRRKLHSALRSALAPMQI